MELYETGAHSFIVRVWLEQTVEEAGETVWRGQITHVVSGEKQYFSQLSTITAFIRRYLESMGVQIEP